MSIPSELIIALSGITLLTSATLFAHLICRIKMVESRVAHVEELQRPISVVVPQQQYVPYGYPISPTAPPLQVSI